jgi:hypothetical protein
MVRAALIWADVQHQGEVDLFQESRALGEPLERGLTQDESANTTSELVCQQIL